MTHKDEGPAGAKLRFRSHGDTRSDFTVTQDGFRLIKGTVFRSGREGWLVKLYAPLYRTLAKNLATREEAKLAVRGELASIVAGVEKHLAMAEAERKRRDEKAKRVAAQVKVDKAQVSAIQEDRPSLQAQTAGAGRVSVRLDALVPLLAKLRALEE